VRKKLRQDKLDPSGDDVFGDHLDEKKKDYERLRQYSNNKGGFR